MKASRARKLHRDHFAFMRAVVQGVDLRASWERYLRLEGESVDLRRVRGTIAWIRAEFAAAARREARLGTARLVLIDAQQLGEGAAVPTLAEFAAERGLEEFSESEQTEAYEQEFGAAARLGSRRARLIARQLEALRWLESVAADEPRAGDGVHSWLMPSLADRIEAAGMPTLFTLIERVNGIGARWWTGVQGVGALKAERIVEWLRLHEGSIGLCIGAQALKARTQLAPAELARVVPLATALVPLEKFVVPSELSGREGRFRAAREQCLLEADNDYGAIAAWLNSKGRLGGADDVRAGAKGGEPESATQRSYRKEAERLLLWAILERGKALSSLTVEDAMAFASFLQAPPEAWCGPRHRQRWSPLWRPLEGPLSAVALRQSLTIVRSLYAFLVAQHYVTGNPFAAVSSPRSPARPLGSNRSLSVEQWEQFEAFVRSDASSERASRERTARAVRWLYATGLRTAEICAARCAHLEQFVYTDAEGSEGRGWLLNVIGKGDKYRQVPIPDHLVAELGKALVGCGNAREPDAPENAEVAILASFEEPGAAALQPWTASGLYKAMKAAFARCAEQLPSQDGAAAERLRRASTHWLRHTHGTHALNGRPGHAPVPIQVIQNNLGHASIGTTSGYLTTEKQERLRAMQGFWAGADG
ncbi:Site-specific recombinase XerD [Variovorax sp. HW608]|uniref:phage integrase family protein n=1 Tax=Variovorax sp. HW608 TaxID=1034889 RepID=UPI00081FF67A|nr:phage integrase family protein [Variovorax sp. HW608]SCK08998.1 Site-specific recombinase XerD [Variovorax sp. HW608]